MTRNTPTREEFLAMLYWCNDHAERPEPDDPVLAAERRDARTYLQSDRCLDLCRKYLIRESPGSPEGGAHA